MTDRVTGPAPDGGRRSDAETRGQRRTTHVTPTSAWRGAGAPIPTITLQRRRPHAGALAAAALMVLLAARPGAAQIPWGRADLDTVTGRPAGGTRVSLRDGVLTVLDTSEHAAARPLALPLAAVAGSDSAIRVGLLDARRRGAAFYLLLLVVGARRAPAGGDARPCRPAADLVWLALDPDARVVASRSAALARCEDLRRSVAVPDVSPPPAFVGDVLTALIEQLPARDPPRRRVVYDRRAPERGLTGDGVRP